MNNFTTTKLTVPIDNVVPNPNNPNKQTKEMFQKEIESIKTYGLLGAITVRNFAGCYEIIGGEHRWKACKELGWTEIPIETVGEMSNNDANALLIILNMQGVKDIEQIAKIVEELSLGQKQLLPYSEEELENLQKLFKFDFSQYDKRENLEERKVTRSFMIGLSEEEYIVVQKALDIAKNDYNQKPIQWLMEQVKHYLDIHLGADVSSDNSKVS